MTRNFLVTRISSATGEPEQVRTESSRRTRHSKWRRLRLRVLDRDGHRCQIRGPHCTHVATQVDHIIPVEFGGEDSEDNAQSVCRSCHNAKTARQRGAEMSGTRTFAARTRGKPMHPADAPEATSGP